MTYESVLKKVVNILDYINDKISKGILDNQSDINEELRMLKIFAISEIVEIEEKKGLIK